MAVRHILRKIFSNFKGLDKRSSHITRSSEHAIEAKNVRYRKSGAISKRKGSHISHGEFKGGYGLVTFKKINTTTGAVTDELVSVASDGKLYRSLESDISLTVDSATIDWQGAKANTTNDNLTTQYYVSNKVNPSTKEFIFTIYRENVEILSYNLGTGLAVSDSNITNLISAINNATINEGICSNTSYTSSAFCTANGGTWTEPDANLTAAATNSAILSKKAAFIDTLNNQEIVYGTPLILKYRVWEEIPMGDTSFQGGKSFGNLGRDLSGNTSDVDFENATFAQINNVLYICSGVGNPIMKYDGTRVYRAGLPAPVKAPVLTATAISTSSSPHAGNEKCINFPSDTTNNFFDMGNKSDFDNSGDNFFFRRKSDSFTISFWANFSALNSSSNASDQQHIFSLSGTEYEGFRVYSENNQIAVSFGKDTDTHGTLHFGSEAWADGNWHHYVITYDSAFNLTEESSLRDYLKLYKDTTLIYANSYTNSGEWMLTDIEDGITSSEFRLGFPAYSHLNHKNLIAKYDEVAIWKSVLASSQIETIYNDGNPNDVSIINPNALKRYYKFEGSSPYDDSTGNFNGTAGASSSNTTMTSADSIYTAIPTAVGLDSATGTDYYFYKYTYEYTDELGNLISSEPSPSAKINIPTNQTHGVSVEYDNLQLGTGFNLTGSSNGKIRIKIYRTKSTATETTEPSEIYYLVNSFALPYRVTVPSSLDFVNYRALPAYSGHEIHNERIENDTTKATSFYIDFLEDGGKSSQNTTFFTNELITYKAHAKRQDLPPNGKYICAFQDCLIVGGQREVNTLSYSLPFNAHSMEIGSEYFPNDDNQEIIDSHYGDKITAISPLKDTLYIFHKNSIHTLTGSITDISGIAYQIDLLTAEGGIGCEAQSSIQELGSNLFFLSKNGIYSINPSEAFPKELSLPIQPEFKEAITTFNRKKAISFNWVKENSLIFLLPVETLDDGADTSFKRLTTTTGSKIFVYDYSRQAWLEWTNLDFSGGIAESNDVVYFNTRSVDLSNDFISYTYKLQDNGNTFDYADGTEPISFKYKTTWEALEEPTVFKKFLRIKSYAFDADDSFESPAYILNANIEKNYINQSTGTVPLDFGAGAKGGWGGSSWSTSPWGSRVLDSIKSKLPTGKAKSIAISFENNTVNENVLLSGYELEIAGPYRKEIKE